MTPPMTLAASLPMYNLPEMRGINAAFWQALRGLLAGAGLGGLPETLDFDRPPVPAAIGPEVLFSQTCGYPLETIFSGQAIRLGTPCYDAFGCDGPTHCGLFVVPAGSRAKKLRDLRGGVFLFNHRHSNSGMNLPRRALAEIADRGAFFARAVETGSQPGNLDRIARGEADATAVDCVTYAFWRRWRPQMAQEVRVLHCHETEEVFSSSTASAWCAAGMAGRAMTSGSAGTLSRCRRFCSTRCSTMARASVISRHCSPSHGRCARNMPTSNS